MKTLIELIAGLVVTVVVVLSAAIVAYIEVFGSR